MPGPAGMAPLTAPHPSVSRLARYNVIPLHRHSYFVRAPARMQPAGRHGADRGICNTCGSLCAEPLRIWPWKPT